MDKILCKVLICLIILIFLINIFTIISYADNPNFDLNKYNNNAKPSGSINSSKIIDPTKEVSGIIISAIRIIGTGVALIMITVVAIKYLIAAPGDRADIKKSSVLYIVGAIIVFGSSNILKILIDVIPQLFP